MASCFGAQQIMVSRCFRPGACPEFSIAVGNLAQNKGGPDTTGACVGMECFFAISRAILSSEYVVRPARLVCKALFSDAGFSGICVWAASCPARPSLVVNTSMLQCPSYVLKVHSSSAQKWISLRVQLPLRSSGSNCNCYLEHVCLFTIMSLSSLQL